MRMEGFNDFGKVMEKGWKFEYMRILAYLWIKFIFNIPEVYIVVEFQWNENFVVIKWSISA